MKNQDCIDTILRSPAPRFFGLPPWMRVAMRVVAGWMERARQRRQLARLDDAALKDIGLTHADVRMEFEKPFWRP